MSFQDFESRARPAADRRKDEPDTASVASGIFQINTAVAGFRRLVVDSIGTTKDIPELRQKIHSSRQRIDQLVKETSSKLRALTASDRNDNVNASKKVEDVKLVRDFQAVLKDYQKVWKLASDREATYSSALPASSVPTSSQSDEQTCSDADKESWSLLRDQKRRGVLRLGNEEAFNEAIIQESGKKFKSIQEQLEEADEIFKVLAVLVHDQGLTIDEIESNIEASYSATVEAKSHLVKASKSVKRKLSWCWWVLIILAVVLVIVLLFFVM